MEMINKEAIEEIYEPFEEKLVQKILNSNRRIQREYLNGMLRDMREKMESIARYQFFVVVLSVMVILESLYIIFW